MMRAERTIFAGCLVFFGCGSQPATPANDGNGAVSGGNMSASGPDISQKQLATIHGIEDAYAAGDAKKFGALFTDDITVNVSGRPDVRGRAGAEQGFQHVMSTYGKAKYHAKRIFTKGDIAVVQWTMTGTHEGNLHGIAPTHKRIGWNGAEVDKFTPDGRIRERHLYFDQATGLGQVRSPNEARAVPDDGEALEHVASVNPKDEADNIVLLNQINQAWEGHDEAKWGTLLADDIEWEDFAIAKPAKGKDGVRDYFRLFATAFPEVTSSTLNAWGVGSWVIEEGTFTGVQKGPYLNLAPTGNLAVLYELNIVELSGGKIKRGFTYSNELDMREQLTGKQGSAAAQAQPAAKAPAKKK